MQLAQVEEAPQALTTESLTQWEPVLFHDKPQSALQVQRQQGTLPVSLKGRVPGLPNPWAHCGMATPESLRTMVALAKAGEVIL